MTRGAGAHNPIQQCIFINENFSIAWWSSGNPANNFEFCKAINFL